MTAPDRIWANPDHWIEHPPRADCFRPYEYGEYIRADLHRAEVEAAVKRAIDEVATITRQHIYYDSAGTGFSEERFDDAIRALLDPAALAAIIDGGGK
jgi:hypothetical protein